LLLINIKIILFLKKFQNQNSINYQTECIYFKVIPIQKYLIDINIINNNYILIFEPFPFHYECTPGFSKYLIDLGYNVDIIMRKMGITTFCYFDVIDKIRIITYDNLEIFKKNFNYFSFLFNKYKYILIETTEPKEINLYKNLNLLNINKTFFVFHHIDFVNHTCFKDNLKKYQILSLGNFSSSIQVNPHFFGNFKPKNKNNITTFFITSSLNRNYKFLINAFEKIKKEKKEFSIKVIGKWHTFSKTQISIILENNFIFKYEVSYSELYKEVYNSDFIIINLDPNLKGDREFHKIRVTGSAQLSYGFLKPPLIHKDFANFYNFNYSNSIIYDNFNFTRAIINAINMKNKDYKSLQYNLSLLSKQIYKKSFYNLKNCLNEL